MTERQMTGRASPHRLAAFFAERWAGRVPLRILFLRDMLAVGTLINIVTTALSLAAIANDAPTWAGLAIFLSPLPYNLFLFLSVWRAAGQVGGLAGTLTSAGAGLWLVGATLI